MRQFELRRTYRDKDITALVLQYQASVHISLYGGDWSHIGAVGIIDPEGNCTVTQFPGHKEGVICEQWTVALADMGCRPAVVEAGIHYDRLDNDGIDAVLSITNLLLEETLNQLSKDKQ